MFRREIFTEDEVFTEAPHLPQFAAKTGELFDIG